MTPTELLARQREREQAATPGPWRNDANEVYTDAASVLEFYGYLFDENAALIVAARNDRALLLDVVEWAERFRSVRGPERGEAVEHLEDALDALFAAWEAGS